MPGGGSVCQFAIATNRKYKAGEEIKEEVQFHNIVAFGKQAELINQYVKKGNLLLVIGRLQTRSWEKDGQKRFRTEIVVEEMQFGPKQN